MRYQRDYGNDSNDGDKVTMNAVNVGFAVVAKVRESETRSSERERDRPEIVEKRETGQ